MRPTILAKVPSWTMIKGIPCDVNAQSVTKVHTYRQGGFVVQTNLDYTSHDSVARWYEQ